MQKVFKQGLQFSVGAGMGTYMALKMDEMIYSQMKRHIIIPIQVLSNSQNITAKDLLEIGAGTRQVMYQF